MNALILISLLGIATLFAGIFHFKNKSILLIVAGLIGALVLVANDWGTDVSYYNDMMHFDNYALAFSAVMIVTTALVTLLGFHFYRNGNNSTVDLYALMLFTLVGGMCLAAYSHLSMLFVGIEILSIPLYILAGSNRSELASNESAMKYFLMGSFASGFLLFGIALIFVGTGTFHLAEIKAILDAGTMENPELLYAGILLVLVGFLFKIAAVPFHFWAPDVYEGAPTIVTALMATVVKTAAFAGFFRLFQGSLSSMEGAWYNVIWTITAVTLIGGNILALYQNSVKRLLAYSSVSHAGYMLLAILALNTEAASSVLYYSIAYSLSTICAFALLIAVKDLKGGETFDHLKGLGHDKPLLGFAMSVAFLSLAGIPPMAGFMAKYFLFKTALDQNLFWIVIIAVISSLIGVYYYLKVIATLYRRDGEKVTDTVFGPAFYSVLGLTVLGVIAAGLFPEQILTVLR